MVATTHVDGIPTDLVSRAIRDEKLLERDTDFVETIDDATQR